MPCAALLESWNSRNSAPSMQRHSFCISRRLADTRSWPSIRSIKKMAGLLALLVAYLIGSIPFGYLMVKLSTGKDVRNAGSGSLGGGLGALLRRLFLFFDDRTAAARRFGRRRGRGAEE